MIRSINIRMGVLALCVWTLVSSAYAQHRKDSVDFKKTQHLGEVVVRGNQVKRVNSSPTAFLNKIQGKIQ